MPSLDVGKAEYNNYIRNGFMTQLYRTKNGNEIVDVKIEYPDNFEAQMLEYSKDWGLLPLVN